MAKSRLNPLGFKVVLIGPDDVVLDRKYFSARSTAVKYATGEGLDAIEGDVARAQVWSPEGHLVWYKSDAKEEDQVAAALTATKRAGLYWGGRPKQCMPEKLFCTTCRKTTLYWEVSSIFYCADCNQIIDF